MDEPTERESPWNGEEGATVPDDETGTPKGSALKDAADVSVDDSAEDVSQELRDSSGDESEGGLEAQYRELTDRHLRLAAEFDNFRKRTARDWTQRVQGAAGELLLDLLEIADNFDRALQVEHAEGPYAEGVRMIFQQLAGLLERRGVEAIDALGQRFDPTRHEALLHVASEEYPDGEVCQEIRRGYMLHDRVLRPAQVAVSRGPRIPEQEDVNEES